MRRTTRPALLLFAVLAAPACATPGPPGPRPAAADAPASVVANGDPSVDACASGHGLACLAAALEADEPPRAVALLRAACAQGVAEGCRRLGGAATAIADELLALDGPARRDALAAAAQGCTDANASSCEQLTQLALLALHGPDGAEAERAEAREALRRACVGGTQWAVCDAPARREARDPCAGRRPDEGFGSDTLDEEEATAEGASCAFAMGGDPEACMAGVYWPRPGGDSDAAEEAVRFGCEDHYDPVACSAWDRIRLRRCAAGEGAPCASLAAAYASADPQAAVPAEVLAVIEPAAATFARGCAAGDTAACARTEELCNAQPALSACTALAHAFMLQCIKTRRDAPCAAAAARPESLAPARGPISAPVQRAFAVACVAGCGGDTRDCACACELVAAGQLSEEGEPMIATELFPPEDLDARGLAAALDRGRKATRLGRHVDAIAAFEEALDHDPESAEALGGLGWAAFLAGQLDRARAETSRALAVVRGSRPRATLEYNLGRILEAQGLLLDALAAYTRALRWGLATREVHQRREALEARLLSADGPAAPKAP